MRPMMKRTAYVASIFAVALTLTVVFQNCGSYSSNFLTDGTDLSSCANTTCLNDLSFVEIQVSNAQPVAIPTPTATQTSNDCSDPSACVDISGYCNTAGYAQSVFYYQWRYNNSTIGNQILAGASCDSQGRFRVLVQIPPISTYTLDYTKLYTVDIIMLVIDSDGNAVSNPSTGVSTKSIPITGSGS